MRLISRPRLFCYRFLFQSVVLFLFCCLGLEVCFGLFGSDKRVRDPSGEEVLLVEVDDDDVLAGGLVTGSLQSSPS